MRGTMAKRLRRLVYGKDGAARHRVWSSATAPIVKRYRLVDRLNRVIGQTVRRLWTSRVIADDQRQIYQKMKRARRNRSWKLG